MNLGRLSKVIFEVLLGLGLPDAALLAPAVLAALAPPVLAALDPPVLPWSCATELPAGYVDIWALPPWLIELHQFPLDLDVRYEEPGILAQVSSCCVCEWIGICAMVRV